MPPSFTSRASSVSTSNLREFGEGRGNMASTSFSFSSHSTLNPRSPPSVSGTSASISSPISKYLRLWELLWPRLLSAPQPANSLFYMKRLEVPPMASTANFRDSIVPSAEISGPPKECDAYFMDMRRLPGFPANPLEISLPCQAEQMVVTEDYVRLLYRLTQIDRVRSQKAGLVETQFSSLRRGAVIVGNSGTGEFRLLLISRRMLIF